MYLPWEEKSLKLISFHFTSQLIISSCRENTMREFTPMGLNEKEVSQS